MSLLKAEIAVREAEVPLAVRDKPIDELSAPEALGRASLSGLHQLVRLIEQPLELGSEPEALKHQRLVGDLSLGANKLFARVAEGEFRARQDNTLQILLEQIRADKAADASKPAK